MICSLLSFRLLSGTPPPPVTPPNPTLNLEKGPLTDNKKVAAMKLEKMQKLLAMLAQLRDLKGLKQALVQRRLRGPQA